MPYFIVATNPANGKVVAVNDDDGNIAVFQTFAEADEAAGNTTICKAWPFDIYDVP